MLAWHRSLCGHREDEVDEMKSNGSVKNVVNVFDDASNARYCYSG